MNSGLKAAIFNPKEMLGILDIRLMGSYKKKQENITAKFR